MQYLARTKYPFESFNARSLNPSQVASSFVPPRQYEQLVKNRHVVIVGPRGSGKTTLLKMLQGEALESWRHPYAKMFREKIDYTGVFIPADRSWSDQVNALSNKDFAENHHKLFTVASFTTHVLRSFILAINYRVYSPEDHDLIPHRRVSLSLKQESYLVNKISQAWFLEPSIPSLNGLRCALSSRLSKIKILCSQESLLDKKFRSERLAKEKILHLSFLESILEAIDIFEEISEERNAKWALLFDELELTPKWTHDLLIQSMRSVDSRLLFKLSLSPFNTDIKTSIYSVMPDNDYDVLPLWYPKKEDGYSFSKELLNLMLKAYGIEGASAEDILGPSEFDTPKKDHKSNIRHYSPGSRQHTRFKSLEKVDKTFRRYIKDRKIDLNSLHKIKDVERAKEIRKIISIVVVRDEFRKGDNPDKNINTKNTKLRSRKKTDVYAGAKSLFAITEGNPRLFIGIVDRLLDQRNLVDNKVPASIQTAEIENAERRFRAFLKTIPCPSLKASEPTRGVLTLIDKIGNAFLQQIIKGEFKPEPKGSFIVHSNAPTDLLKSLGEALNAGAIIYVPDKESDFVIDTTKGKRFRLSFLLAPQYHLPLTLLRATSLSSIIQSSKVKKKTSGIQKELFEIT